MSPKNREFLKTWDNESRSNTFGKEPYGDPKINEMTEGFVGLKMEQLVSEKEWSVKGGPRRGQTLFHRMMIIMGIRCPDCLKSVFMLDDEGSPLPSLQLQTMYWNRHPDQDELALVCKTVPTKTVLADTLGFWPWHLHHMDMPSSDPSYILPSMLPKKTSLSFGKLPSDDNEPVVLEKGTRLWHYSLLQINCSGCHEQGESRKYWTVDKAYTSLVFYDVPSKPTSIREILDGDKYTSFKSALTTFNLDNSLTLSTITFEELNYVCVNTLGYMVKDLVTFDKMIYECTAYRKQRKMLIKMIALNFIKKESGLCIGRKGASTCPSRDICNILPRRLTGIHGDHGEGAGEKNYSPSVLLKLTWTEFEAELVKLDGMRCGHCHRGK